MAMFFQNLFSKAEVVDQEKISDQATLSFEKSRFDSTLFLALANQYPEEENYKLFVENSLNLSMNIPIDLATEVAILTNYALFSKVARKDTFFYTLETKGLADQQLKIFPFLLMPLVKNAFYYGYNTMDKYPVRIRLHIRDNTLQLEVSNRVNHYIGSQAENPELRWYKSRLHEHFPQGFNLLFNSNSNLFKATLILDLTP